MNLLKKFLILPLSFALVACTIALACWGIVHLWCLGFHQTPTRAPGTPIQWAGEHLDSDLILDSTIGWFTPIQIYIAYYQNETRPTRIVLSGPGGDRLGGWLSGLAISTLGMSALVSEGSVCASSCVNTLVTAGSYAVDPKSYLLFHAGKLNPPPFDDCQPCLFIKESPLYRTSESLQHLMLAWAGDISPKLASFINNCTRNPLNTYEGLALSGLQIAEISSETNPYTCDDIAVQDLNWLTQNGFLKPKEN
ncbi:hypothetical protein [uncultured Agrobacterium sp.]|uniref:hypothetical protein n=1 Tax=uncultured Agrobacterium sp. TaxID=157277 RepID=UPI0025EB57F3|nr:hypothetical protein [uncultured Agrobacterium sp.]